MIAKYYTSTGTDSLREDDSGTATNSSNFPDGEIEETIISFRNTFYKITRTFEKLSREMEKLIPPLMMENRIKSQWILREGPFLEFNIPNKLISNKALYPVRMMRCNRKGMGLRVRRDN